MTSRIAGAANSGTPLSTNSGGNHLDETATGVAGQIMSSKGKGEQCKKAKKATAATANATGASNKRMERDEEYAEPCLLFFEDEVFKIDRKGRVKFGVVTDTYSDSYSGDEDDELDTLNRGEVRVAFFPDGKEVVQSESMIGLADRTLLPGDVVRRIVPGKKSTSGQSGYVREVNMKVDVRVLGTKYVIKNVPCERLRTLSPWSMDTAVCLDSWVGSTVNVEEKAILKTVNGARIEISSADFYRFKDLNSSCVRDELNTNIFYTGNIVTGRLPAMDRIKNLTPEITLPTNKKGRPIVSRYTVEQVRTESVSVMWQCKALSQDAGSETEPIQEPEELITGDKLSQMKRLNLFESCMLQIRDRSYLKFSKCDKLIKLSEWDDEKTKQFQLYLKQQLQNAQCQNSTESENVCEIPAETSAANSHTKSRLRKLIGRSTMSPTNRVQTEPSSSSSQTQRNESKPSKTEVNTKSTYSLVEGVETISTNHENVSCDDVNTISAPRLNPRHSKRRHVKKKMRSLKKSLTAPFIKKETEPKDGEEVVVETLLVYSTITVVWQDGTIEVGIPSTQLFPIHHLDNHEFFPGDYVCSNTEELKPCLRDYGIVQHVDHEGRTGVVNWFTTYVNIEKPIPTYNGQTEVSVYDLKDHPDFQYRPGTMVIRVANFVGEDANSTAGQIIDNYPDGRIKVWWVNGHISMCYPQDLFEVSQFDHDGEYDSEDSEDSWETESEKSQFGSEESLTSLDREVHILAGIDSAKDAMKRLQSIIRLTQDAQKPEVIKDLLSVYKNCRFLDRLLHTNFFHEDHFHGIIKRKCENEGSDTTPTTPRTNSHLFTFNLCGTQSQKPNNFSPRVVINLNSRTFHNSNVLPMDTVTSNLDVTSPTNAIKRKSSTDVVCRENQRRKNNDSTVTPVKPVTSKDNAPVVDDVVVPTDSNAREEDKVVEPTESNATGDDEGAASNSIKNANEQNLSDDELILKYKNEYFNILISAKANIAKAFEKNHKHKTSKNDSGNYTRTENGDDSLNSHNSSSVITPVSESNTSLTVPAPVDTKRSPSNTSIELAENNTTTTADLCEIFCILINEQMEKCRQMIDETYCKVKEKQKQKLQHDGDMDAMVAESEKSELSSIVSAEELVVLKDAGITEADRELETNATSCTTQEEETQSVQQGPMACSSPTIVQPEISADENCFEVLPKAFISHRYHASPLQPVNRQQYQRAVQREYKLMKTSLPPGVKVRAFEDRMDLMSVMMEGPKNTPYEDALFCFDIQLVRDYPKSPPACQYISYCSDRLNPNLYEEGKVCVSLLGTWTGRDTEVWGPDSTLLQVIVSIQGLILVDEPYYNEAGYEKQRGSQHGQENSRMYNEMAVIKVIQSTIKQLQSPPEVFAEEMLSYLMEHGYYMYKRIKSWVEISEEAQRLKIAKVELLPPELLEKCILPTYPFLPCSRGCSIALTSSLKQLKAKLDSINNELSSSKVNQECDASHENVAEAVVDGNEATNTVVNPKTAVNQEQTL